MRDVLLVLNTSLTIILSLYSQSQSQTRCVNVFDWFSLMLRFYIWELFFSTVDDLVNRVHRVKLHFLLSSIISGNKWWFWFVPSLIVFHHSLDYCVCDMTYVWSPCSWTHTSIHCVKQSSALMRMTSLMSLQPCSPTSICEIQYPALKLISPSFFLLFFPLLLFS